MHILHALLFEVQIQQKFFLEKKNGALKNCDKKFVIYSFYIYILYDYYLIILI